MAVVKVEEVTVESLFANLTHIDMQYALWCIEQDNPAIKEEGKRQFAAARENARKLIALLDATRSALSVEDRSLANSVRKSALLVASSPEKKSAEAYWNMTALFSELLRPTQPFIARMAYRVL